MQDTVVPDSWLRLEVAQGLEISQVWRMKPTIEKLANTNSGREYSFQVGAIEKAGQTLYVKGVIPIISQNGERKMIWGILEHWVGNQKIEVPVSVFFSFVKGVESDRNAAVAGWADMVSMFDLHDRATKMIKADPTKKIVVTKMLENAAAAGTRLLQTGMLPLEAIETVQKIQEEANVINNKGNLTQDGGKKVFMTGALGGMVAPPTS
jgi:hypothetical protein